MQVKTTVQIPKLHKCKSSDAKYGTIFIPETKKLYTLQYTLVCMYIHYTLFAISRPTFCLKIRCKVPHRIRLGRVLCVCRVVRISWSSRIPALRHRDWLPGWFETGEVSSLRAWTVDMLWHHFVAKVSRCQHQHSHEVHEKLARFVTTHSDNVCPQTEWQKLLKKVCNSLHQGRLKSFRLIDKYFISSPQGKSYNSEI